MEQDDIYQENVVSLTTDMEKSTYYCTNSYDQMIQTKPPIPIELYINSNLWITRRCCRIILCI